MKVAISAGHGLKIRGASGPEPWGLDEVDEARFICTEVASQLIARRVQVAGPFFDDVSTSQNENLERIVDWHNEQERDLDISVHFNAYEPTSGERGTEVLYVTQEELANELAAAIAEAGEFINRGAKHNSGLYFLNNTDMPAVLLEICFVDAAGDVKKYDQHFEQICGAIAAVFEAEIERPEPFRVAGKVSWFGGPEDAGVDADEGLAFLNEIDDAPELFLPYQPAGTTGLARRLDPSTSYIAMRFDYDNPWSKEDLASGEVMFLVRAPKTGREYKARPADWGPHEDTGRVADISPGLMNALGIETDDEVEITLVPPSLA